MTHFFGVMMSPNDIHIRYTEGEMHFSNVAMENGTYSKIYLTVNGIKFILATLSRKKLQERICVQIEEGDHFEVENDGNSDVSLLGYQTRIHQSVDLFAPCGSNGCMTKSDST